MYGLEQLHLHQWILWGFSGLLIWAAVSDLSSFTIPNSIVLALLLLCPLDWTVRANPPDILMALGVAGLVFAVGAGLFAAGMMGGGDVKLMAVIALWAGPGQVIPFLLLTTILGGGLGLFMLTSYGERLSFMAPGFTEATRRTRRPMPYGVAIAAAGLYIGAQLYGF